MQLFLSTLSQMAYLFTFILLGFVLVRTRALPKESARVISKLESNFLIPAMVFQTFFVRFTPENLSSAWKTLLYSLLVLLVAALVAVVIAKILIKEAYFRNIFTFGLSFANFGFMGYAVVNALFPEIYFEYVLFTLPLWSGIYLWGVPNLLLAEEGKQPLSQRLRAFLNPMFICMVLGMICGITGIGKHFPKWSLDVIGAAEGAMSPLAMMLIGITLEKVSFKKTFSDASIYLFSFLRLILFPALFLLIGRLFRLSGTHFLCAIVTLAMPMGLNAIVIPAAYGKDTTRAAGMALVSHLLSAITIPILFLFV